MWGTNHRDLWAHPRDRSWQYKDLSYWTDLAKLLEKGKFDGLFIADVLGVYDVLDNSNEAAIRQATQVPVNRSPRLDYTNGNGHRAPRLWSDGLVIL